MRKITIAMLSLTALATTAELATARDGCGPGRYFNGYRCVGEGYYYRDRGPYAYAPHYQPRPYYEPRYLGNGITQGNNGALSCVQPGFSVQDGVCKPYRGY